MIDDVRNHASSATAALKSLEQRLLKIAGTAGDFSTLVPALSIHRRDAVTDPVPCIYELGLTVTVTGAKKVLVGTEVFDNNPGQGLLASVDLPVVSYVTRASDADPYLGLVIRLDSSLVLKVAAGLSIGRAPRNIGFAALSQDRLDSGLLGTVDRLVALTDEPKLAASVAPLIEQEIIARLLLSPHGPLFMKLNASDSPSRHVAQTMAWLKQHFMESISIEALADIAHMSPSTFRQHFKAVTGLSPLKYLKQLRLQEARQLMLNQHVDAGAAGLQVGYESVSQFSREYARLFGEPPLRDIRRLRTVETGAG
ncbi:AraC family transcriptional regulator [Marinobacter sp. JSM 1782161]|uniref:AraC family transcriptional regulator n=1 Tax=Marinobacter sp. JSM 1782161 TaxID=2685906 RepID=UPI001402EC15|nr:AraC family transcriptional regulator [Marinobacter sp. JSM 1782161]